jgi:hypothetical protein
VYRRVVKFNAVEHIKIYAEKFLHVVKLNKHIFFINNRDLNNILAPFASDDCVLRVFYRAKSAKKIKWTNNKAGNGSYSLRNFVKALNTLLASIGQNHVETCFKKAFGDDVLSNLYANIGMYDDYTQICTDRLYKQVASVCKNKGGLPVHRKDLKRGVSFNISILCQYAEGDLMFKKMLPMIKEQTGCTKLITLHDAIFCPESYKEAVVKAVGNKIDIEFYKSIFNFYKSSPQVREAAYYNNYKRRLKNG